MSILQGIYIRDDITIKKIIKQMREIMAAVSGILVKNKATSKLEWLYPEHKNGFIVLGIDFMIDDKYNVKMIEVNNKQGYGYNNRKNDIAFSESFFKWINSTILEPYYKFKDIAKCRNHPTYLPLPL